MCQCAWCGEELKRDKKHGWIHQDGFLYKGKCFCQVVTHPSEKDVTGKIICPTWKDDHVALPSWPKKTKLTEIAGGQKDDRN